MCLFLFSLWGSQCPVTPQCDTVAQSLAMMSPFLSLSSPSRITVMVWLEFTTPKKPEEPDVMSHENSACTLHRNLYQRPPCMRTAPPQPPSWCSCPVKVSSKPVRKRRLGAGILEDYAGRQERPVWLTDGKGGYRTPLCWWNRWHQGHIG